MRSSGPWLVLIIFIGFIGWLSSQRTPITSTAKSLPRALPSAVEARSDARDAPRSVSRHVSRDSVGR